jgi:hypothetical protein
MLSHRVLVASCLVVAADRRTVVPFSALAFTAVKKYVEQIFQNLWPKRSRSRTMR